MADDCAHLDGHPQGHAERAREDCLKTAHFHATGHPIIEGYDPREGWGGCYVEEVFFDLSARATQRGQFPNMMAAIRGNGWRSPELGT